MSIRSAEKKNRQFATQMLLHIEVSCWIHVESRPAPIRIFDRPLVWRAVADNGDNAPFLHTIFLQKTFPHFKRRWNSLRAASIT